MRFFRLFISVMLFGFAMSSLAFAAAPQGEGGDQPAQPAESAPESQGGGIMLGSRSFGPGTEAKFFDDKLLIATPTPIATPIFRVSKEENEAWSLVRDVRDLIIRCRKDLRRYENMMREGFNKDYNNLASAVAGLHTYALLYKRDRIEHVWSERVDAAEKNLMTYEEFAAEFQRDVKEMEKKLERTKQLLDKSSSKMQKPDQIRREYELNKQDAYFIKKGVEYFTKLFERYFDRYEEITAKREARVEKLLREHRELHRP